MCQLDAGCWYFLVRLALLVLRTESGVYDDDTTPPTEIQPAHSWSLPKGLENVNPPLTAAAMVMI